MGYIIIFITIIMPSFYPYLQLYKDYAQRYRKAQETFTQCLETSIEFKELIKVIEVYIDVACLFLLMHCA